MPLFRFRTPEGGEHQVRAADEQTARQLTVRQVYHQDPEGEGDLPYTAREAEEMRETRAARAGALILLPPGQ